jgi:hypothetical protein
MAEDIVVKSFLIAKMNNERYKTMKEQGTLPANSFIFTPGVGGGMASMPMGTIFASAIPISNPKVHLLDGSTILQEGIYSQFAEHIKSLVATGHNISCTQSEFDISVSTYGQCGKFVIDDPVGTIRLPLITEFIASNNGGQEIGLAQLDAFKQHTHYSIDAYAGGGTQASRYALESISSTKTGWGNLVDSSPTAGEETRPKNIRYPYYIVLATGYKSTGDIELDNLLNEINSKPTLDEVYPIGSIYTTVNNHQNPAKIFGGTWELIQGKFLLGATDGTDQLDLTQLGYSRSSANYHYWTDSDGNRHSITPNSDNYSNISGEVHHLLTDSEIATHSHHIGSICTGGQAGVEFTQISNGVGASWNGSSAGYSKYTQPAGGGLSHNNMPPYFIVYMYQRVE